MYSYTVCQQICGWQIFILASISIEIFFLNETTVFGFSCFIPKIVSVYSGPISGPFWVSNLGLIRLVGLD